MGMTRPQMLAHLAAQNLRQAGHYIEDVDNAGPIGPASGRKYMLLTAINDPYLTVVAPGDEVMLVTDDGLSLFWWETCDGAVSPTLRSVDEAVTWFVLSYGRKLETE